MKTKFSILLSLFFLLYISKIYSQSSTATNASVAQLQFLGFNGVNLGGGAKTLQIRNDFNQPIQFGTNNVLRMVITNGGTTFNDGFIGIGNGFLNPMNRLHLHQGPSGIPPRAIYTQWTNTLTNNTSPFDGLKIGINGNGIAEINQQENLEMDFLTSSTRRMMINHNRTGTINGAAGVNTFGFVGIGTFAGSSILNTEGPRTLLHLEGTNNTSFLNCGWRTWMRDGLYVTQNADAMYVGMRSFGSNRSDAMINWSDDASGAGGVDKLRFVFTDCASGNTGNTDPRTGLSFEGYEFMRMVPMGANPTIANSQGFPIGHIGMGPMFTNAAPPQSRLHINAEDVLENYVQISNTTGTGQTATDGFKVGIATNNIAELRQQEILPMDFLTANTQKMRLNGDFTAGTQYSISGYTFGNTNATVNTSGYLLLSLNNLSNMYTYTQNGAFSQLHINGAGAFVQSFGYRPWMKTGVTFTSNNDLMYVGQKSNGLDVTDAVFAWSDNPTSNSGPDVLKFVFTGQGGPSSPVNPLSPFGVDGYEYLRMAASPVVTNSTGNNVGHIGIGPVFSNIAGPQSRLHINAEDALATYMQVTNQNGTGQTATDGFKVGIATNNIAELRQQEVLPMDFLTANTQKMRLNGDFTAATQYSIGGFPTSNFPPTTTSVNTTGYLLLSTNSNPWSFTGNMYTSRSAFSQLHINGEGSVVQEWGYRPWMKTGVTFTSNDDQMYVGQKSNGADITDAVIQWSDNGSPVGGIGPDVLKFVFTDGVASTINNNPLSSSNMNGLELMRMVADAPVAGNPYGKVGIGPLFTNALPPARRLEIVDGQTNNSQLRLTYTQNANPALGIWTDFQTTNIGDLAILPFNSTIPTLSLQPTFVGIQTTAPGNQLEINFHGPLFFNANTLNNQPIAPTFTVAPTGWAGLRFSDLNSASIPQANPNVNNAVLSVDANGDVIYVPGGGSGFGQACGATGNAGQLTQDTEVPTNSFNFVFTNNQTQPSNQNNVGIGLANGNCVPQARLDVLQTSTSAGTIGINSLNTNPTGGVANPSIGLKAKVTQVRNIAGWFESAGSNSSQNYPAIYVPQGGGNVAIGYTLNTIPGLPVSTLLWVNGDASFLGNPYPSDAILKTDTLPLSSGLDVVRNMRIMQYRYNGLGGLPSNRTYYGVIAEELRAIAPYAVDTTLMALNENDTTRTPILRVRNEAVIYTAINAIKQLDSTVTALQNAPASLTGMGTTNYLAKWNGGSSIANSQLFDDGTNVGVGTAVPQNKFDLVRGGPGVMGKGTYETASIERNGDTKMGIYSSTSNTGDGTSITLGFTNLTNNSGYYPGFEIQELYNNDPGQNLLRFNALGRTASGAVLSATPNILNILGNGNIGIGTSNPSERLHVVGNILATGSITQNSDATLKQNVDSITNALGIISQLKPRSFTFDTVTYSYMNLPGGKQYGIIAQDADSVLPEIVKQSMFPEMKDYSGNVLNPETHYKTVNYTALIPFLIKGMQEQNSIIKAQNARLETLESTVSACCTSGAKLASPSIPSSNESLASGSMLFQNRPNPYTNETSIRYFVPENSVAMMMFFDQFGSEIKSVELPFKGITADLHLSTVDLAAGIYSYSLIVNGKVAETKRMIKTK